jgi:hypothetical protein
MHEPRITKGEAETLAHFLDSASRKMCYARHPDGTPAWPSVNQPMEDMFTGFYQIAPDGVRINPDMA